MSTSRRILIYALVLALLVAVVPLTGRLAALPCQYIWRYAISYGPSAGHIIVPGDAFPHFPTLCADILGWQGDML